MLNAEAAMRHHPGAWGTTCIITPQRRSKLSNVKLQM